ncbi:MAG: alpha-2-macroglobulin, partial [Usitatibacter sp.]
MIAKLRAAFGGFVRATFGTWTAPPWMGFVAARIRNALALAAARPLHTAALAALIAATLFGSHWAYRWYQSRPKPVETAFSIKSPPRTEIENEREPEPLVIAFDRSAAPLGQAGKELARGITLEPPLEGTWRWQDDKTLHFKPKDDWPVGGEYKGRIDLDALASHIRMKETRFTFKTAPFVASIARAEFYQDPTNPAAKKAVFELNFSHPVNTAELEKRFELQLAGQAQGVWGVGRETTRYTVSYDKLKLNAYVHSEALPTPQEDSAIALKVAKGVAAARGGKPFEAELARSVRVPGLASLVVREVQVSVAQNARAEPEQIMLVQLSATTHEKDIAKALSAWVLPVNHPKQKPEERMFPYAWSNPAEVTDEVLRQSSKIDLELAAGEREHSESHGFRYTAPIGRYVYVQVERALKSFGGYVLAKRVQYIAQVPPFPPQLNILGEGALVSLSGEKKVAILVRDLPGVRMEIGRVLPSQLQHLVSQSAGAFAKPEFGGGLGSDNLTERFERKIPLLNLKPGKAHYEALNLAEYLGKDANERRGIFLLKVQGYDPRSEAGVQPAEREAEPADESEGEGEGDSERATGEANADPGERSDSRLLLVTDLGILVKRSLDGTQDVFVQSIATGLPVAGANVEVIGKNGLVLFSQATDAVGRAAFPKLDGLVRERTPQLYLVRKGGDMSFLPLNRRDRGLDFSRFDVGGVRNTVQPGKLSAYLFSDRGMYRPGDTFHIGLIVKSASWGRSVAGLPLEAEVLDPRGLVVKREKIKLGPGGFNEIAHTTLETSPTGSYTVNLYVVAEGQAADSLGSTTVKVQEFLPDRMKVSARLSTDAGEGWVHPQDLKALVNVQNLFGTPAENRRVEATLTLRPAYPAFPSHPAYFFYDPQRAKEGYGDKLTDGTTDASGDAEFDLGLDRYARATYRLHFLARAFEPEGGRSVTAETSSLVSERAFLVGYKPDGDLAYVARGSKRSAHLIAIDPRAKKIAAKDLKLELVERRYVSVLMKQPNGTYKYESRPKEVLVSERALAFPAAGLALALESATPGNFFYRIRDAEGLELNRVEYSVAGAGNVTRSMDRNAELQLTLNRKSFAPGEEIEVSIRAPYVGAGLITIERDKVYAHQWFKASTQATVQKIRVPVNFEGGGYLSVQYIRDPSSDEIFTSPLSYGVVPFAVDLDRRTNKLTLSAPAKVKPGEPLKITLTAAQPARVVVFAVDEGILQVARYQTPEPLGFFFQKRALDVRTSQILDLILPEFRKLMQAAAPGGDAESALGRNLNPFKRKRDKPAVFWSGIVDVKGEAEFTYGVPDTFNGTLRLIAVAVNDQAIGVAQEKATVQGDFVLLPNAPLAVAPGDVFDVSVGVANNVASSGKDAPVVVTLKTSAHLEVEGANAQSLTIGAMREGVAIFRVKAKAGPAAKLGSATLAFGAAFSDAKLVGGAKLATDVSVRPATPHYTRLTVGSFTGSTEVPVQRDLHAEFRATEAAVSPIPLVLASGLSAYLDNFPY